HGRAVPCGFVLAAAPCRRRYVRVTDLLRTPDDQARRQTTNRVRNNSRHVLPPRVCAGSPEVPPRSREPREYRGSRTGWPQRACGATATASPPSARGLRTHRSGTGKRSARVGRCSTRRCWSPHLHGPQGARTAWGRPRHGVGLISLGGTRDPRSPRYGGRSWVRTSDPLLVRQVLFR